jgi:hypothetical protein
MIILRALLLASLLIQVGPARAQLLGGALPEAGLGKLSGTGAPDLGSLIGRTILLEFFAYW